MDYKDSFRIGLLSFIAGINYIFFELSSYFISVVDMISCSIFIGIIFAIFTAWFINTYFHGIKNTFSNLKKLKNKKVKIAIWIMITTYSVILTYLSIIPGIIFLIINLTYIKWIKN